MYFDKNKLINEWMDFREESISILNSDDRKHIINFDEHSQKILKNVKQHNKKYIKSELLELDNEYSDYASYWNRKYYLQGFKDAMEIFLFGISD